MEFKDKLKQLRKEKKISQYKLAEDLCVSRSVIAKWETGLVNPSDYQLKMIANYFEIEKDELIFEPASEKLIISKNEKILVQKRIIKILVVLVTFLLAVLSIFTVYHYPRTLSSFIKEDLCELKKFEIKEVNDVFYFNIEEDINIIDDILSVKVVPIYSSKRKHTSSYEIILYFEENTYIINGNSIKSDDRIQYFYEKNYSIYSVIYEYIGG